MLGGHRVATALAVDRQSGLIQPEEEPGMDVRDAMRGARRTLLGVLAVAFVVFAAGPVGPAMADEPHVTITSPPSPVNDSVIESATPSFEGTGDPVLDDGGPVTFTIYKGPNITGPVVQRLVVEPELWLPGRNGEEEPDGGTWRVGPAQGLKALEDGTYTAQAKQITEPLLPPPMSSVAEASVTFTVKTAPAGPPPIVPEPPPTVTPPASLVTLPAAPPASLGPVASFSWFPSTPEVGQSVSLVSTSTDVSSPITGFAWALTGISPFHAGGPLLTTSFATAGDHVVRLRVTDANGASGVVTQTIHVASAPVVLMQPFPVVRIAGFETSSGVRLRLLTAQAPIGARITVSCHGRGCPAKSQGRVARSHRRKVSSVIVEFRRFERALRAGVILEIRISKPGEVGKFTRFVVRHHKLPERVDTCLDAGGIRPMACPSS